jgi:hypothetical protein
VQQRWRNVLPIEEVRLLHRHGDEWSEMRPEHHAPAEHDIERQILKGGRIFRCTSCDAQFRVVGSEEDE